MNFDSFWQGFYSKAFNKTKGPEKHNCFSSFASRKVWLSVSHRRIGVRLYLHFLSMCVRTELSRGYTGDFCHDFTRDFFFWAMKKNRSVINVLVLFTHYNIFSWCTPSHHSKGENREQKIARVAAALGNTYHPTRTSMQGGCRTRTPGGVCKSYIW